MKTVLFLTFFLTASLVNFGQNYQVILEDNFIDSTKGIDLSLSTTWGTPRIQRTAFKIIPKTLNGVTFNAITYSDSAKRYTGYIRKELLRTSACLDYLFDPIDRTMDTILVEFDAVWDQISGTGQAQRLVASLIHEYQEGGVKPGDLDSMEKDNPFGRPAYHVRIMPTASSLGSIMNYGGGPLSREGNFEQYAPANSTDKWWLPGFISSQFQGQAPGDEIVPGTNIKAPYPRTPSMKKNSQIASSANWKHFTWKIKPERLELWHRNSNDPPDQNALFFFMEIPKLPLNPSDSSVLIHRLNVAHGLTGADTIAILPRFYNWFNRIKGLRFFMNGGDTYLANVKVSATTLYSSTDQLSQSTDVKIYPNPAHSQLFISIGPGERNIQAKIFDIQGKEVMRGFYQGEGIYSIDTRMYFPGIYHLVYTRDDGKVVGHRFMIE